jgi:hypothetical protein
VSTDQDIRNFRLLGQDASAAWGGGSNVEVVNGHAYVGGVGKSSYVGVPGFTVHDVTDPRRPRKVWEFRAPPGIHMHKLRIVEDRFLYVNSERIEGNSEPGVRTGLYIFDIGRPAEPRRVGFYDMPGHGPHRFGIDRKRKLALLPCAAEGWMGRVIWTLDVHDPLKPQVVSVWGLPWQRKGHERPVTDPSPDRRCRLHGPPVIRGDRMFGAFGGGGVAIIDCSDLADMKLAGHVNWTPPFVGKTHTAWPLGDRPYLIVTDEASGSKKYWDSQFMWIVDIRDEANPMPVSTFFPEREAYFDRPGRFGAHNLLEYMPADGPWKDIVFLTYFNAGLRAVDVRDPLRPIEVGHFAPPTPEGSPGIQSNDIGHDEHGRLYLIDRSGAGMHILEYTG